MISPLHTEVLAVQVVTESDLPDASGEITETIEVREWGPCIVQQRQTTEDTESGEDIAEKIWASGPLAEWITEVSKIVRDGRTYYVEGFPAHFKSGVLDHTEITLWCWKGKK